MPIGKPDWSNQVEGIASGSSLDYAELAARLNSPLKDYRTGRVLWMTSFEDSDASFELIATASASWSDYTAQTKSGANAKHFNSPTPAGGNGQLSKRLPFTSSHGFGLQYAVKCPNTAGRHWVYTRLIRAGTEHEYIIRYFESAQKWEVYDSGVWQEIVSQAVNERDPDSYYDVVKLVLDFGNDKYSRFILNGTSYDISDYSPSISSVSEGNLLEVIINPTKMTGVANDIYFDDIIVTDNEPIT